MNDVADRTTARTAPLGPKSPSVFTLDQAPPSGWLSNLWYEFGHLLALPFFSLAFSVRFEGSHHVPETGPVLVASNHQSFLDPVLAGLAVSKRHLCYLARKTLFQGGFFEWLMRSLGAVPVDQEGFAKAGMRAVIELLGEGRAILIFPEGERTLTGKMLPLKPGIHLLLRWTKAPVVPVGIAGAYDALPRGRNKPRFVPFLMPVQRPGGIAISVGKPLDSARLAALPREQALTELFDAIQTEQWKAERLRRQPRG